MAKGQNHALLISLLAVTCLAPPAAATATRWHWLAQGVDNPDGGASPLPAATAPPALAPNFTPPAEGIPQEATLNIVGSSSMAVITRSLVQAFQERYPDTEVVVAEAPSEMALQEVLAGNTDLAAIGRTLSDEQRAQGLTPVSVSREKIAIIVGADNPFSGQMEALDFVQIFRGQLTNWQQLGGPDIPLRFVDRPATSDTRTSLGDYEIFGGDLSTGGNVVQVANDSTAEVVEALGDNGIGYAIASQVLDQDNVRVVPMHDTMPDNAQYPYSQPRHYVYLAQDPLPAEVEAFLALATNPEGQAAVAEAKAAEAADVAVADLPGQVLAIRPDGQGFVTGDREGNLLFWNADGTPAGEPIPAHTGPITAIAFSGDGQRLITGGADGTIRLWDTTGAPIGDPISPGNGPVTSLIVKPDGGFISATDTGIVQQWDSVGNPVGQPITAHDGTIRDLALSPDNATVVTAGADGIIRRWNAADLIPVGEPLTGHQGAVQVLSMQPDGSFFSGGADGTVRQWAADGTLIGEPVPVSGPVNAIATNADGTSIAVGDETGALQYLSGEGVPIGEPLTDVGAPIDDLAFTPAGQLVVSAGAAPQLRDSTGQVIPIPEAESPAPVADEEPGVAGLPPALQDAWSRLQELPPQVLWIIPLALLALLLLGLLRSFRQDEEDLEPVDDSVALPPEGGTTQAVDDFSADDFATDDFAAGDFPTDDFAIDDVAADDSVSVPVAGLTSDAAAESLDPSLALAKQTLSEGVSMGNIGQYQTALDRFNKAIELADMERLKAAAAGTTLVGAGTVIARGLARRGNALANLGRSDEALKSLNRSLEMDPNDAAAWIGKGNVLMPMGQLDEALFCFDKAIELNSNLGIAWQGKGKALQKMGRNAEARQCLETAESLGGLNDDIPLDLGTPAARGEGGAAIARPESSVVPSPIQSTTPAAERPAITPGPIPPSSASLLLDDIPEADALDSSPPADPATPEVRSNQPPGPIGIEPPDPLAAWSADTELPPDVLAAISDVPAADSATFEAPHATETETPAPAAVDSLAPLPDAPETAVPEEILQAVEALPAEPEVAAPDAPLAAPVEVPPEVEAILAGDSDLPTAAESSSEAVVNDPMATFFGDDVAMDMRSPAAADSTEEAASETVMDDPMTTIFGEEEPAMDLRSPDAFSVAEDAEAPVSSPEPSPSSTVERPSTAQVPDRPTAADDSLAGLPPEVLEALQGIPADSPDSFGLSTSPKPSQAPPPPPPPHNPRIRDEAPDDFDIQE